MISLGGSCLVKAHTQSCLALEASHPKINEQSKFAVQNQSATHTNKDMCNHCNISKRFNPHVYVGKIKL